GPPGDPRSDIPPIFAFVLGNPLLVVDQLPRNARDLGNRVLLLASVPGGADVGRCCCGRTRPPDPLLQAGDVGVYLCRAATVMRHLGSLPSSFVCRCPPRRPVTTPARRRPR